MDSTNNFNNAINDRLRKSNTALGILEGELLGELGINIKIRLMSTGALISSILLYSFHIVPISKIV